MNNCRLKRLGTIDADIVEANPIVFQKKLYRFEYIRENNYSNKTGTSYFRLVNAATGEIISEFGQGFHMGCAFVHDGTVYVSCVERWGGHGIYLFRSRDLAYWDSPRLILSVPERGVFNTSICKTDNGFTMVYELDTPNPGDQVFTMYFAGSGNLERWEEIPGAVYGEGIYCGAPMLRYFDGYYYFFHVAGCYEEGFDTMVVRSRDLIHWSSPKTVMAYHDRDRNWLVTPSAELRQKAERTRNINVSDLDFCDLDGKLYATYSWGDQAGNEFLCLGEADGTEKEFCRSFWQE